MMEWTPDTDAKLTELHNRRLGMRFISSWTHWPSDEIRLRLVELGLTPAVKGRVVPVADRRQSGSKRPATVAKAGTATAGISAIHEGRLLSAGVRLLDGHVAAPDDDGDDGARREPRGCPRGYLKTEAHISAPYRRLGRDYR
jgi:hypothetical protein